MPRIFRKIRTKNLRAGFEILRMNKYFKDLEQFDHSENRLTQGWWKTISVIQSRIEDEPLCIYIHTTKNRPASSNPLETKTKTWQLEKVTREPKNTIYKFYLQAGWKVPPVF